VSADDRRYRRASLWLDLIDEPLTARDDRITHRWGGPLGVPRDWHPSVGYGR
jgi:hypothetical protein